MHYDKSRFKIRVADINFEIDGFKDDHFYNQSQTYIAEFDKADFSINMQLSEEKIENPNGKKLTDKYMGNWYLDDKGVYICIITDDVDGDILAKVAIDMSKKCANAVVLNAKTLFDIDMRCCTYNLFEMILHFVIFHYNGLVFHASSIAHNGEGVAFSALSGTGKSTHTALWLKNHPENTVMINDDKPILRYFENDGWYIYGTPWAGTTGINTNLKVPLKALVFLERCEINSIRQLSAAEVIVRFFEAVISPMSDEVTDKMLELLGLLIEKSRVCLLKCNMEDEAMETVRKFLYE